MAPSLGIVGGHSVQAALLLDHLRKDPDLEVRLQPIDVEFPGPLRWLKRVKYVRTVANEALYVARLLPAIRWADVVHVFAASYFSFLLAPTPALVMGRLLRKPVVLNYHSGEAEDHLARWRTAAPTLRLASRVVVPSRYLVEVFRRAGIEASAIFNAIDLERFRFRDRDRFQPRFLVNRNFEAHYGVEDVLRAFAVIRQQLPEATLTVAGDGPLREQVHATARALRLNGVRFVGRVVPSSMPAIYDEHDVFLNASTIDNMPLSILEAYAAGLAVVTSDAGGVPWIAEDGATALVVPCRDPEALAKAAVHALANQPATKRMVLAGREFVRAFTPERVVPEWASLYRELTRTVA